MGLTATPVAHAMAFFRNRGMVSKDGQELGPQDYLKDFETFVKENPRHIEALETLLRKPKEFDTKN